MVQLVVKSGIKQLPLFQNKEFPYFEAYTNFNDNLEELLNTSMKLISIHMPNYIEANGAIKRLNFADEGEIGRISFEKLKEFIVFSNKHNVKYIVIHLGFFNIFNQDRNKIIDKVANQFRQLEKGNVKLCLENVPCWLNSCFECEPLISVAEHFLHFKKNCPEIGCVLDVDHLAITTVFNHFYSKLKEKNHLINNSSIENSPIENHSIKNSSIKGPGIENFQEMEEKICDETASNEIFFKNIIENNLKLYLSKIKPDLIHAVGSDFCNYRLIDRLPLVGEALPLGFKGNIKEIVVEDKINHAAWFSLISKDCFVINELMIREDYDYISKIKENWNYLESLERL